MSDVKITVPNPDTVERLEGFHRITFGPGVVSGNSAIAAALGTSIANTAEAERQLEAILKSVVGGNTRVLTALLASFRGHKQLLGAIEMGLKEAGIAENMETFSAISPQIRSVWEMRDQLAHAIWAECDLYPGAALRLSARKLGRMNEEGNELLRSGEWQRAFDTYKQIDAEIWRERDFEQAALATQGAVNSLMAFAACISQSPAEASWLHTLLRSQGLLNAPPWKLRTPTPPLGTADTQ